jgi:hypothetical protein
MFEKHATLGNNNAHVHNNYIKYMMATRQLACERDSFQSIFNVNIKFVHMQWNLSLLRTPTNEDTSLIRTPFLSPRTALAC